MKIILTGDGSSVTLLRMLMIRLQRVGRTHEPTFRLVLTESTNSTKSGRFLDILGSYDPRSNKSEFNADKIKTWMGKGAKVSDTVHNLLISQKIISGKKINVLPRKSPPKKEEGEKAGETGVIQSTSEEIKAEEEVVEDGITKEVEAEATEELKK
jgi:small subunit ribosomal protein S16